MMKEETPRANRFHIGLFGRRNSGKSSLVNMLTGQQVAVVSDVPGTTTDMVLKNIELPGVGASVLVDTAGYDDEGELGGLRVKQTVNAARRVDLALIVVSGLPDGAEKEKAWAERFGWTTFPFCIYIIRWTKMAEAMSVLGAWRWGRRMWYRFRRVREKAVTVCCLRWPRCIAVRMRWRI